jgi:sulfatase modifying factor 1
MVMVLVPAGSFQMGWLPEAKDFKFPAEYALPRHRVALSTAYYMDEHEVTIEMWERFAAATGARTPKWDLPERLSPSTMPATWMTWVEAMAYAQWTGSSLPTEAQWERAAKAGHDEYRYPWGELDNPKLRNGLGGQDGYSGLAPVKSYPPNAYGLFDMSGNAGEYCADWFLSGYYQHGSEVDPLGPAVFPPDKGDPSRVVRGGSAWNSSQDLRVDARGEGLPGEGRGPVGLRCVRTLR